MFRTTMTAGIVRVLFEPLHPIKEQTLLTWRMRAFRKLPGLIAVDILTCTDGPDEGKPYKYENTYHLSDVNAFIADQQSLIPSLLSRSEIPIKHADWQVYERFAYSKRDDIEPKIRRPGTVVVAVGMSPNDTPENIADFHAWYNQEHIPLLRVVPGWREGSRYVRVAEFGDRREFAAPFLAVHQYNEENGLGGDQWRRSIESEWTQKVLKNLSAPNHRRVWRVEVEE